MQYEHKQLKTVKEKNLLNSLLNSRAEVGLCANWGKGSSILQGLLLGCYISSNTALDFHFMFHIVCLTCRLDLVSVPIGATGHLVK